MTTQTEWQPIDTAAPLASPDIPSHDRLEQAAAGLQRLRVGAAGTFQQMRLHEAGHGPRMQPWCLTHGQPPGQCTEGGCDVALAPGHSDTTGQAAMEADRAASDRRELTRIFDQAWSLVSKGLTIMDRYPSDAALTEKAGSDGPGDDWCTNCYKDGQYFEPITMQKRQPTEDDPRTEIPYHRGLCKWCGDMSTAHGFLPPVHLLDLHHRNVRITAGMWAEETRKRRIQKKKEKGKKGARRT